jgi:hypothetical protein
LPFAEEQEPWVGKILSLRHEKYLHVQWLLRKEDLHFVPWPLRSEINLDKSEHLMTKNWEQTVDWDTFIQTIRVAQQRPKGRLNDHLYWWERVYDAKEQSLL